MEIVKSPSQKKSSLQSKTFTAIFGAFFIGSIVSIVQYTSADARYVPPSASSLPGDSGLLSPAPYAPLLSVSAANAGTSVPSPRMLNETNPLVLIRGAHLTRTIDPAAAISDSITPVSSNSFQTYSAEITTNSLKLDVQYRGVGIRYRIWVDGHPISVNPTVAPSGGAFYRTTLTFPDRQVRTIRYESDATRFTQFTVSTSDSVTPPVPAKKRAIIIGDSFTEGTGANGRFNTYANTLCQMSGWDDCWVSGSGGTGYLNNAATAYANRVKFRDRIVHDALLYQPDVIVVTGGKNDGPYSVASVQAEATLLFQQIRTALPNAEFIVTSPFPSSGPQAQGAYYTALNKAIKASSTGLADHYLDVTGVNAYITGTGNAGAPNGTGNADYLVRSDGVHPTPLGHDTLGKELFKRYVAQLPQ